MYKESHKPEALPETAVSVSFNLFKSVQLVVILIQCLLKTSVVSFLFEDIKGLGCSDSLREPISLFKHYSNFPNIYIFNCWKSTF